MDELNLLLEQCLAHAQHVRGLSPSYIRHVRKSTRRFVAFSDAKSLRDCTPEALEAFLLDGSAQCNWKPATFRSTHRDVGFFFRYLLKR